MSLPFIRYLLSAMKLELLIVSVLLAAVALLQPDPMTATQPAHYEDQTTQFLVYLLIPLGLLLPVRIFCNSAGVAVWLSSRGLTRRQQFVSRLVSGLIVVALSFLWIGLLQALGIRLLVQQSFGSPWFPMVRWHEVSELPSFARYVCVPFFVTTLVLTATMSRQSLFPAFRIVLAVIAAFIVITVFLSPHPWMWIAWPIAAISAVIACGLWTQSEQYGQ